MDVKCPFCSREMPKDEFVREHLATHAETTLQLADRICKKTDIPAVSFTCAECGKHRADPFAAVPVLGRPEQTICFECAYKRFDDPEHAEHERSYLLQTRLTPEPALLGAAFNPESFLKNKLLAEFLAARGFSNNNYVCDMCGGSDSAILRFRCRECDDYDLCARCYFLWRHLPPQEAEKIHPRAHGFKCLHNSAPKRYDELFKDTDVLAALGFSM